ncbi:MAG: hypothetical protein PHV09_07565 [Bacteroidales bacterium]|nr:hypothetical protein [Bacteroidales bacterium]
MKKILLITMLLFAIQFMAQAQEKEKVLSQADQFSSMSGTLIQKEFIEIGKIRALDVKVLKIKDLNSGTKMSALRFEYTSPGAYSSNTHLATLDTDEIEGLIKTITNIQTNVINTTSPNYTEYIYRSKTGLEFGAFCSKSESNWVPFIKLDKYSNNSLYPLKIEDITKLLELIKKAQEVLK